MRPADRTITELPLRELFNERGPLTAVRRRDLSADGVRELIRAGPVNVVVAICGSKPIWVDASERYSFWRSEVLPRLADPTDGADLDDFPGGACYFASEWLRPDGPVVVLLEMAH